MIYAAGALVALGYVVDIACGWLHDEWSPGKALIVLGCIVFVIGML